MSKSNQPIREGDKYTMISPTAKKFLEGVNRGRFTISHCSNKPIDAPKTRLVMRYRGTGQELEACLQETFPNHPLGREFRQRITWGRDVYEFHQQPSQDSGHYTQIEVICRD